LPGRPLPHLKVVPFWANLLSREPCHFSYPFFLRSSFLPAGSPPLTDSYLIGLFHRACGKGYNLSLFFLSLMLVNIGVDSGNWLVRSFLSRVHAEAGGLVPLCSPSVWGFLGPAFFSLMVGPLSRVRSFLSCLPFPLSRIDDYDTLSNAPFHACLDSPGLPLPRPSNQSAPTLRIRSFPLQPRSSFSFPGPYLTEDI